VEETSLETKTSGRNVADVKAIEYWIKLKVDCFEIGDESWASISNGKFSDHMSDYPLLKDDLQIGLRYSETLNK
jgi:hypothetical protein